MLTVTEAEGIAARAMLQLGNMGWERVPIKRMRGSCPSRDVAMTYAGLSDVAAWAVVESLRRLATSREVRDGPQPGDVLRQLAIQAVDAVILRGRSYGSGTRRGKRIFCIRRPRGTGTDDHGVAPATYSFLGAARSAVVRDVLHLDRPREVYAIHIDEELAYTVLAALRSTWKEEFRL